MMMKCKVNNNSFILLLFFVLGVLGCKEQAKLKTEEKTVTIDRFEQELFACKTNEDFEQLYLKHPEFYLSFCRDILKIQPEFAKDYYADALRSFINYYGIQMLKHEVDSVFPDLTDVELQLSLAELNFKKLLPDYSFPKFVSYLSEYTYANVSYDTIIGIGLDMYLGANYELYKTSQIDFPEFMIKKLRKEYIAPNAIKALGISMFEHQLKDKRYLAFMLFEGKVRYLTKQLLPTTHDTLIFGYTQAQMDWCKQNEPQMWAHYIEKKMLFSTEVEKFMRYFNDGPFTIADGVPQESAPSIGVYTGYRIIESYMKETGNSLQGLMENNNWEDILQKSKYRPE